MENQSFRAEALKIAISITDDDKIAIDTDEKGNILISPTLFDNLRIVLRYLTDKDDGLKRGNFGIYPLIQNDEA
jgi:hypothetical protein